MEKEFKAALHNINNGGQYWKTCFDWVSPLTRGGIYLVNIDNKYMYYNPHKGEYLIDMCFDMAKPFCQNSMNNDFSIVQIASKYNILKIDGTLCLDKWVDWAGNVKEGYFDVENKGYRYYVHIV